MKKIIICLMMLFTLSVNVMADEVPVTNKVETINENENDLLAAKYDFTINYRRMGCFLGMTLDQLNDFEIFFNSFKESMRFAYYGCSEDSRDSVVKNAVNKNIREMRYILNEDQYKKYLLLINTTLRNRGFEI